MKGRTSGDSPHNTEAPRLSTGNDWTRYRNAGGMTRYSTSRAGAGSSGSRPVNRQSCRSSRRVAASVVRARRVNRLKVNRSRLRANRELNRGKAVQPPLFFPVTTIKILPHGVRGFGSSGQAGRKASARWSCGLPQDDHRKAMRAAPKKFARTHNSEAKCPEAGVDRKTARKYLQTEESPEQLQKPHRWRTRANPLAAYGPRPARCWPRLRSWRRRRCSVPLRTTRERIESPDDIRTFQRRVRQWREPQVRNRR